MSLPTGEEIGGLLRDWRKAERLSQEELAASAGVAQRTISYMERGQSITLENLWRLLDYFGKGVEALSTEPSRNAPGSPRTHPQPDAASIPLAEHRAVVRAFQARIEALEHGTGADLRPETLDRLGKQAEKPTPPEPRPPGSARNKRHRPGHSRRKP